MTRHSLVAFGAAALVAGAVLALPANAAAHGRGGVVVHFGGYYGFGPYGGWGPYWGWGPWYWPPYGPYGYYPEGGVDHGLAMMAGFGAVDIDAKPNQADVWVDGKFVAQARDLDGYPSFLWLKQGEHTIALYKGGYRTFEEKIEVQPGMQTKLRVRLERGQSEPPGRKPGEPASPTVPAQPSGKAS
jgi:hypothetical protein